MFKQLELAREKDRDRDEFKLVLLFDKSGRQQGGRMMRQKWATILPGGQQTIAVTMGNTSTGISQAPAMDTTNCLVQANRSHQESNELQTRSRATRASNSSKWLLASSSSIAAAAAATTTTATIEPRPPMCQQPRVSSRPPILMLLVVAAVAIAAVAPLATCQSSSSTEIPTEVSTRSGPNEALINNNAPESTSSSSSADQESDNAANYKPEGQPNEFNSNNNNNNNNNNNVTKLKPVNFTLVDEIFESVLSDDEVVKRWKFMDSQIQDGMKSILKMIFPQIVSISQDAKVSGDCSGGILKWILSLRNLRSWAIKMLDATGKPTAGIFQGSLTMYGNYRQCLAIRAPDEDEIEISDQFEEYFRGQFCVIHLKPWMPAKQPFYHLNSTIEPLLRKGYKYYEKTLYDELAEISIAFNFVDIRMDLCVPSTCTVADIQRVAELLSRKLEMRAKVMRCDISSRQTASALDQLDRSSFQWLAFPLALLLLTLISTLLVGFSKLGHSMAADDLGDEPAELASRGGGNGGGNGETTTRGVGGEGGKFASILQCLSIGGALKDRLAMPLGNSRLRQKFGDGRCQDQDSGSGGQVAEPQVTLSLQQKPLPLYGLRNVFIFWFLIVQMTVELKYQYLRESLILRDMIISYWPFQIIVNSSMLFESLILITAFTFSYTCLEATLKDLIGYVVDKYIRLVISIVSIIGLTIVTPLINIESPVWRNFVEQQSNVCKSNGYLDLFFLQNFISYDKICLPHTWLFCVELQLILLSIPLVLLLKRTFFSTEDAVIIGHSTSCNQVEGKLSHQDEPVCLTRITLIRLFRTKAGLLSLLLIVLGLSMNFYSVFTNQLPPSWFYTFPDVEQKNYYFSSYLTKTWTHLAAFVIGLTAGHICRSTIQLRDVRLLKKHQQLTRVVSNGGRQQQQDSPQTVAPKDNQNQSPRQSRSGSTSTIMAMDQEEEVAACGQQQQQQQQAGAGQLDGEPANRKQQRQFRSRVARVSSQVAATICMSAIVFSTFAWSTKAPPTPIVAASFDAGSRLLWSLALVGLMVQLCLPDEQTGKYSTMARLLSHPLCTLMGRLSFLVYLISPYVHTFVLAVEEQSLFPSLLMIFHLIVGNIVIIYIIAFILAIVIEQPLRRLISRFVLGKRFRKQKINISTNYYHSTNNSTSGSIATTISTPLPKQHNTFK